MKDTLKFLTDLSRNNNKEWFDANKGRYLDAKSKIEALTADVLAGIRSFDDTIGSKTETQGVLIVSGDSIVYEKCTGDITPDKIAGVFSVTKSITSLLCGIAVDEGYIKSIDDPVTDYLPAHFDLDGNASGSIPRTTLLYYPLIGAVIGLVAYWTRSRVDKKYLNGGLLILTSGIELIILSSTLVTLTQGTKPFFMLAEPVILVIALMAFIVGLVKSRRR